MNILLIITIMVVNSLIGAVGSLFLKKGSESFVVRLNPQGIIKIIKNWEIILGIFLYVLSTISFIWLLKSEDLSLLYPMTSLGYIFIVILSVLILKERLNIYKIIGITTIILGVVLVTL